MTILHSADNQYVLAFYSLFCVTHYVFEVKQTPLALKVETINNV